MNTGKLIRQMREASNLTQQELGELIGCSKAAISQLEARDDCKLSTLGQVAKACGYQIDIFLKLLEVKPSEFTITI